MSGLDKSLFVNGEVFEREVKLSDGSCHKLYFKQLAAVEFRRFYLNEQSTDEDVQAGSMAKLIAASLCEPDGKPAITFKQALQLKTNAATAIAAAVLEVNGIETAKVDGGPNA